MKRYLFIFLVILVSCTATQKANKLLQEGNYLDAMRKCQQILKTDSLNTEAHFILGKCYYQQGELEAAIQAFTSAWKIQPASNITAAAKAKLITAKLALADTLINRGETRKAREEFLFVLELDSTNVTGLTGLGHCFYTQRLLEKAAHYYHKALNFQPDLPAVKTNLAEIKQQSEVAAKEYQRGLVGYKKYRYRTAVKQFEKALKHKADHQAAKYYLAMSKGAILYNQDNKSRLWEAITEFGQAMTLRPESGEPHYFLALAYEKKDRKDFDNAIEEYKLALDKSPKSWFAKHCRKKIKKLTNTRDVLKKFWGK